MITAVQIFIVLLTALIGGLSVFFPQVQAYVLQIFSVLVIIFVLLRRWGKKQTISFRTQLEKQSLYQAASIAPLGAAILLLVGVTGGLSSWWLPLIFIYFFMLAFANQLPAVLAAYLFDFVLIFCFTNNFGEQNYGAMLSLLVFMPVAIFAQKYYLQTAKETQALESERAKIAYYNLYAEKQQAELLTLRGKDSGSKLLASDDLTTYVATLIPQIDQLQQESRFPENQLIISAQLTKIALGLRQALKKPTT